MEKWNVPYMRESRVPCVGDPCGGLPKRAEEGHEIKDGSSGQWRMTAEYRRVTVSASPVLSSRCLFG